MRLYRPVIEHVAFVSRPCAGDACFAVIKSATGMASFRVFVPFGKIDRDGTVAGRAYNSPYRVDRAGDYATQKDLSDMKKSFDENGRMLNYEHRRDLRKDEAVVVDSKLLEDGSWWIETRVKDPELLKEIRNGRITGFSIGGRCSTVVEETTCKTDEDRRVRQELIDELERDELEEMTCFVKQVIAGLEADDCATDSARLEEALTVAQKMLEDAHGDEEVFEVLRYCERILDYMDAVEERS